MPAQKPRQRARVWWSVGVASLASMGFAVTNALVTDDGASSKSAGERPAPAVRAAAARTATIPLLEEYRGELVANVVELAAQSMGRLVEVHTNLGDKVTRGQLLAVVDATETRRQLTEAKAGVAAANAACQRTEAQLENAQAEAARAEKLLQDQLMSVEQAQSLRAQVAILEAELATHQAERAAARARVAVYVEQLSKARLVAPFDGAVAERHLDPGASVQPGNAVLRLVQGGPLEVRFRASERYVARLKPGVPFTLTTLATEQQAHPGKVSRISAEVSRTDRTIVVEGLLDTENTTLRPGMYATVHVQLGTLTDAVLVPSQALVESFDEGRAKVGVFVVEQGIARYRDVDHLGRHEGETAVSHVAAGDQVIVFGQNAVADGRAVRVVSGGSP